MTRLPRSAVVALLLLLAGALVMRIPFYDTAPRPADNRDEMEWAWLGQSLIQDHSPSSWSLSPVYPSHVTVTMSDGGTAPYVHDWLDNPPLFGLVVGAAALAAGETTPQSVTSSALRWIPLLLSLVSLTLLFLLAWRYVRWWALLAGAVYAFSPWNAAASHLVEAETLMAPMLLGVLLLTPLRSRRALAGVLLLCFLAPLVKVVGIAVGGTALVVWALQRRWAAAAAAGVAAVAGIATYLLYGIAVNASLFNSILHYNASRHSSFITSAREFLGSWRAGLGPLVPLHDPLWYVGLVAAALLLLWGRRFLPLLAAIAAYTVVMGLTGPDATGELSRNGWYRITIVPLLAVAIACLAGATWQTLAHRRRAAPVTAAAV